LEDTEKGLLTEVEKEIEKLKYYLEESDEIIKEGDFIEIEVTHNRTTAIHDKLCNLIAHVQELKIERGIETARAIRQWKKDTKEIFAPWILQMGKIENAISQRRKEIQDEIDRKKAHEEMARDLRRQEELRDKEREMWEEKFKAELKMTEKKIELERTAKASLAKLPQLKITPFKGTAADWVRFENMFLTQIDSRPISDEEKFGYLLESVGPKVRDRIANLKPGTVGYKTAWERLKKEYGQTKVVVNAHMDEIINLTPVRGSNYSKVQEFYEKLSKNFDALLMLEEGEKLHGFVLATLNKLPQVKPDLVRVDENWEDWSMEDLIDALQKWLRRNNTKTSTEQHKKSEKHLFTLKGEKPTPYCLFCRKQDHWSDSCTVITELVDRRKFFMDHNLCFNCGRSGHRLIKEIKKTLHKTLGRSRLSYEAMESVVMDIERNLNNRPLTYVEAEGGEEVLTPNMIMWGRDAHPIEDIELIEDDKEKLTKMNRRLEEAKAHAWRRWKREYIHSLMEGHRLNKKEGATPVVGEVVLVVGDEKNRGEWKKGKVSHLIQGKDGIVRGVILFHKGHTIERPLQLVCPLEIRGVDHSVHLKDGRRDEGQPRNQRVRRPAAQQAAERIAVQMRAEEED